MNKQTLARRMLAKVSPVFAKQRTSEIIYSWISDMWSNPDKYRAAIRIAPVAYQPKLDRMLDLYMQCAHIDIHRPPQELESEMLELGSDPDLTLLVDVYFRDKQELSDEFLAARDIVVEAGLYP